jgi:hypothetical protein
MLSSFPRIRAMIQDFIEKMARIVIGEPARIIRKSTLERLERLAYRELLREAARSGDTAFIKEQIQKNQLTRGERLRIARKHTALADWPDVDEDAFATSLFDEPNSSRTHVTP